jgi:hypothetical protein
MSQQYPQYQAAPFNQPPKKKRHILRNTMLAIGGLFALLIVAAVLTPGQPAKAPTTVTAPSVAPTPAAPRQAPSSVPTTSEPTTEAPPAMTASQEQAVGAAENYLSISGFSRKGLIKQLSSEYGEGFSVKDATFAVDYLKVDWNEQAAKKAKEYLSLQHFSRSGLIKQLESAYGEQFTHAQAVYGVTKAGL